MPRRKKHPELTFAVCAESAEDRQLSKTYLARRGWNDCGREYAAAELSQMFADAGRESFNAAFMNVGGGRWFAQIVPDREFPKPQPKPQNDPPRADAMSEQDLAIVGRVRAMMVEGPKTAEAIAEALMRDGVIREDAGSATKQVRRALLRSGRFCVSTPQDGQLPIWEPWQPQTHMVDDPSGRRTIYTQVLSTTGVPVSIAIPLKRIAEIRRILFQDVLDDYQKSQHGSHK